MDAGDRTVRWVRTLRKAGYVFLNSSYGEDFETDYFLFYFISLLSVYMQIM